MVHQFILKLFNHLHLAENGILWVLERNAGLCSVSTSRVTDQSSSPEAVFCLHLKDSLQHCWRLPPPDVSPHLEQIHFIIIIISGKHFTAGRRHQIQTGRKRFPLTKVWSRRQRCQIHSAAGIYAIMQRFEFMKHLHLFTSTSWAQEAKDGKDSSSSLS